MTAIVARIVLEAACVLIQGKHITAAHLAQIDPAFQTAAPSLVFSYAPKPGSRRTVRASDVQQWAQAENLTFSGHDDMCFEREGRPLTNEQIAASIEKLFATRAKAIRLEILEHSGESVPPGRLEFSLKEAPPPPVSNPENPVLWRGKLISTDGEIYPIWIKVRLTADQTVVRTREPLRASTIIQLDQLETVVVTQSPLRVPGDQDAAAYAGKMVLRGLEKGALLELSLVAEPPVITKGDQVNVQVTSGSARLAFTAQAVTSGSVGEAITLINPSGLKKFRGLVAGPGQVDVLIPPLTSSIPEVSERQAANSGTTTRSSR